MHEDGVCISVVWRGKVAVLAMECRLAVFGLVRPVINQDGGRQKVTNRRNRRSARRTESGHCYKLGMIARDLLHAQ